MAPDHDQKKLVFANFGRDETRTALGFVNSDMARLARQAFADRPSYDRNAAGVRPGGRPYCAVCSEKPASPYNLENVRNDIRTVDDAGAIPGHIIGELTTWD
jgi:hypothetical protein